jgi:hypothetical protein
MKIKFYKIVTICCVVFLTISCGNSEDVDEDVYFGGADNSAAGSDVVLRINQELFDSFRANSISNMSEGDPFTIKNAKKEGDFIEIELSYSGGCKKHSFEIIWDGLVYTDAPCHINLQLVHRANNDLCEALITETIFVNLKELIGDVTYKDTCTYNIFSTYNSTETPDVIITN